VFETSARSGAEQRAHARRVAILSHRSIFLQEANAIDTEERRPHQLHASNIPGPLLRHAEPLSAGKRVWALRNMLADSSALTTQVKSLGRRSMGGGERHARALELKKGSKG
jgi:hypothetical protein